MISTNSRAVVLSTARTPFGKLGGGLAPLSATTLGAAALAAAIERAKIDPSEIEHAIFGEVLQAGVGQNPARQVVFKAGLAKTVTADTVNKVCASGLLAVVNAMRSINAGANAVVAAGGMESMSNAPYLLRDARWGYRFGDGALVDAMIYDGLWDQYFPMTMATQGSKVAAELGLTREEQDRFAFESHRRAPRPMRPEISPTKSCPCNVASKAKGKVVVDALPRRGKRPHSRRRSGGSGSRVWDHEPSEQFTLDYAKYAPFVTGDEPSTLVDRDEAVRGDASIEAMGKLRPLEKDGTITAGNAPGVNDGAAALILADAQYAQAARPRGTRDDRRPRDGRVGLALHLPDAGDGRAKTARPQRPDAQRHRGLGNKRGVLRRGHHVGAPSRARRKRGQPVRRRRRDGPPDRRVRRAYGRNGDQPAAQTWRRTRHCVDLFGRRSGRRAARAGRLIGTAR